MTLESIICAQQHRERQRQHRRELERKPVPTIDDLFTTSQAAKFLGVHVNTVRRWANSGAIRHYRISTRHDRRFSKTKLVIFLEKEMKSSET